MEKTVLCALVELTRSIAGNQHLHPPVIVPEQRGTEARHIVLYDDQDRLLEHIPAYRGGIMPLGDFDKTWIVEAALPKGFVAEFIATTVKQFQEVAQRKVEDFYKRNMGRVDDALLKNFTWACQNGYIYLIRKKTDLLGRLPPQQGDFLARLKAMNHLGALHFSWEMVDDSCDRLRGYGTRVAALDTSVIPPKDKLYVQTVMGKFLDQDCRELTFWSDCYLNLRKLYNEMIHMVSVYHLMDYQQRTSLSKERRVMLQIDKIDQEYLYGELIVSFNHYVCSLRTPGFFSRVVEYALNGLVSANAKVVEARDPRPFLEMLALVKEKSEKDYVSIADYDEAFEGKVGVFDGKAKACEFSGAVCSDYWHLAYQIAQNGLRVKNKDLDWARVIEDLRHYQNLVRKLIFVSYELFKIKCKLALRLTNKSEAHLNKTYIAVLKAEYQVQQALINLRLSYHKSVLTQLDKTNQYWQQLKTTLTGQITRFLLENKFLEDTPSYDSQIQAVQRQLLETHQLIDELLPLMNELQSTQKALSAKGSSSSSLTPQKHPSTEPAKLPDRLSVSVSTLASREELDLHHLMAYTRFRNGDAYKLFVSQPEFMKDKTIRAAIVFCVTNMEESIPGWPWDRERDELLTLHRFVRRLDELTAQTNSIPTPTSPNAISSSPTAPSALRSYANSWLSWGVKSASLTPLSESTKRAKKSPAEILQLLWEAFQKKVDTDYSEIQWQEAETSGRVAKLMTGAKLAYRSGRRKYERGSIKNEALNWRGSDFIESLELQLGLSRAKPMSEAELERLMNDWVQPSSNNSALSGDKEAKLVSPNASPAPTSASTAGLSASLVLTASPQVGAALTHSASPSSLSASLPNSVHPADSGASSAPAPEALSRSLPALLPNPDVIHVPSPPSSSTPGSYYWLPRSLPVSLPVSLSSLTNSLPGWTSVSISGWLPRSQSSSAPSPQPVSPVTASTTLPVTTSGTPSVPPPVLPTSDSKSNSS